VSRQHKNTFEDLSDFTVTARVIPISLLAVGIGVLSTLVAWALLRLIALFTNAFYYGRFGTTLVSPAGNHLGWYAVLVPVAGGLIIGFMAYYGSERIRGHGIPEALESILINGSKVQPRLAVLKPISSAISIGSGGPFGAEGPIIMTGGAIGSVIAQLFHLTATERKTLLVAGAAAGMSATFATPIAAVLLAVELLLFEWKPRSAIPVALASADCLCGAPLCSGLGAALPSATACHVYWSAGLGWMRHWRSAGRLPVLRPDARRLCGGRLVPQATGSLEVVAGYWGPGSRIGRVDLSAGAGRWLRYHSITAPGRRDHGCARRCADGEVGDLGNFSGLGNIRRCAGAATHDGRRRWVAWKRLFCQTKARGSGRW
jgi:hypothetical protein